MDIRLNPNNPRQISNTKYEKLKKSIKDFPEMLELRPIVVDKTGLILGGNMRYRALQDLGIEIKPEWIKVADKLTEEEKRRFIIEDNLNFGEFDYDILSSNYDINELLDLGIDEKDLQINDIDFNNIISNEDREINDKCNEVSCPKCGYKFQM